MDKERLKEIEKSVSNMSKGMPTQVITWQGWKDVITLLEDDYKYLFEQSQRVEEQQKEIDELKNKNKWLKYELDKEVHVGDKLEKDNDRLREALEFYADEDNHDFEIDVTTSHLDANSPILNDRGEKAREALEQR